jgi:FKBP-type peptidyl-prolyl cis-trans isomerase FklB
MKLKLLSAAIIGFAISTPYAFAEDATTAAPAANPPAAAKTAPANNTTAPAANTTLNSDLDKLSYSIGADLGKNFKKQGIDISPAAMVKGLQDGINGVPLQLTEDQMKEVLGKFQKELIAKRTAELNKKGDENKVKGEAYMAENKAKPGVITLPSGLQYKIIEAGKGAKPGKEDTVTVDYTGTLINGQVFDSSEKTGKPATFKVSQVIPGWTEALQLMPEGSTWEVVIPASLAYGNRSMGGPIGPNETLVFKIHLISVKKTPS